MSQPRPLYLSLIASTGTWVAFSAFALFLLMMAALFGPFEACGSNLVAGQDPSVAIWTPPATPPEQAEKARVAWQQALSGRVRWFPERELDSAFERADVVLVPHARSLDAAALDSLEGHLERGGAAVVVGAVGVRSAEGGWLGWQATESLLGAGAVSALKREQSYFVAAGPRSELTVGLDPGQRLALAAEPGLPALAIPHAALRWSDYELEPVGTAAAALHATARGKGRLLWLAAGPEYAHDGAAVDAMRAIAFATLAWAGRWPVAEIAAWPEAAPFAALLAMDTEGHFANAAGVAELARSNDVPITFLAVSDEARKHPELTAELARVGEVGSHGDVHEGFEGQTSERQRERIGRSRRDLESLGVPPPRGFRPPLLSYDAATREVLSAEHFDYVLGNHDFDRLAPTLVPGANGSGPLAVIARVIRDDVDLIERERHASPQAIAREALADADEVARVGGLYYFSFHTHLLAMPDRVAALPTLARGLRERGAWLARGAEIADWWRSRADLGLEVHPIGPRRVGIAVVNRGGAPIERAVVRVHLQRPIGRAELRATTAFQGVREGLTGGSPDLDFTIGERSLDLRLPVLPAGRRLAWHLDWSAHAAAE